MFSDRALTYVPMPPNQIRSTGALRIAEMREEGSSTVASVPRIARISFVSLISFMVRGKMPPPLEISFAS